MNKHSHILVRVGAQPDSRVSDLIAQFHIGNMMPTFTKAGPTIIMTAFTMDPANLGMMTLKLNELGHQFMLIPVRSIGMSDFFEKFIAEHSDRPTTSPTTRPVTGTTQVVIEETTETKITRLKDLLNQAVAQEKFERAAELQSEINTLTGGEGEAPENESR